MAVADTDGLQERTSSRRLHTPVTSANDGSDGSLAVPPIRDDKTPGLSKDAPEGLPKEEDDTAAGFVHTVCRNGEWTNEVEDGWQIDGSFARKEEAVGFGRDEAMERETEHVIHDQDGSISERNSYGNDPPAPPG